MTALPNDIRPNLTDPENTASNGPAVLNEETLQNYTSERTLSRPRASAPEDYDLIILSSFGGPEGQEDVIPFLRNVTAGRGIPDERLEEVATHYRANGGVSPINAQNRALLAELEKALAEKGPNVPITWANRNWEPYVTDVVKRAYDEGKRKILVLATSAYPGYSSCRQYREDYGLALDKLGLTSQMQIDKVRQYWDTPGFITPFIEGLAQGIKDVRAQLETAETKAAGNGKIRIMFATHSVPTSAANEAGPRGVDYEGGSAYVEKHLEAARAVLAGVQAEAPELLQETEWELVYQSRSGPPSMPWLEPDINDALEAIEGKVDGVVIVPLGFVSDHMEVIWDLDTEALDTCARLGFAAVRTPTPGTHPAYVEGLRQLIAERVAATAPDQDADGVQAARASVCGGSGWFDACNPDCCKSLRPGSDKPVIADYSGENR
ncbi:MAG: ferrochelatase [Rothia sp. (in: high G+C Gram-positive bacteria)]|nr:ferrochelatase [Rothia sp. (in: high G+C Gram-positive bacteria)]